MTDEIGMILSQKVKCLMEIRCFMAKALNELRLGHVTNATGYASRALTLTQVVEDQLKEVEYETRQAVSPHSGYNPD